MNEMPPTSKSASSPAATGRDGTDSRGGEGDQRTREKGAPDSRASHAGARDNAAAPHGSPVQKTSDSSHRTAGKEKPPRPGAWSLSSRPINLRADSGVSSAVDAMPHRDNARSAGEDDELFSQLLTLDPPREPAAPFNPGFFNSPAASGAPDDTGAGQGISPTALWQALEPELAATLAGQPAGLVLITLLLPKLGEVDARMSPLPPAGWDIALRLEPSAWTALEPYHEHCRRSLKRRLAGRVKLRFEQRERRK
ncbi:type III secretion system HrpP C-terminal domain-containing protein [Sodalis sp. dw_96]|uniref:type III secretion system HrpP C-terminal domain-containing protein n=1 Tax=Sodalis sp. dw_96 TaxID=2719794 RepID=UPI001BD337E2|nr:type III secretion system HrpP C-terminal domain-containing protein [Sodalis sp. dw_96]